ncbi:MAG: RlmE family RNA methyltransferase, partial [Deferribacteraceae bacterium]|nr:RlmE family RNA methyltransferase [Deferribacteraceae bacterium]
MYNRKDSYYYKAKQEGYKSRAAYKIIELNQKYKLIRKGDNILDCGAAPGGWSQVALNLVGQAGRVVAVDYAEIMGINNPNFTFIQGDMKDEKIIEAVHALGVYDTILTDMAPKTTGIKVKDHVDSLELVQIAFGLAERSLKPGGSFVAKIFDGEDRQAYIKQLEKRFKEVRTSRP